MLLDASRRLAPSQPDRHQAGPPGRPSGVAGEDIYGHVIAQAEAAGITGWQLDALDCLVNSFDGIQLDTDGNGRRFFVNGQHKTRAMLDQGVRRTIIVHW